MDDMTLGLGIIFLFMVNLNCAFISETSLSYEYSELCPYTTLCTKGPKEHRYNDTTVPCCIPCSCDDNCQLTGNCCPDKDTLSDISPRYPCRNQRQIFYDYLHINKRVPYSNRQYLIIDGCPSRKIHNGISNETIHRCYNAEVIDDLIFVTGSSLSHTYLNEHCAKCNGETSYTKWDAYFINVKEDILFSTFEERNEYVLKTGNIELFPPFLEMALPSICQSSSFNSCNMTKNWNFFNNELIQRCLSFKTAYYSPVTADALLYFSNVYCYLCNMPRETVPKTGCDALRKRVYSLQFTMNGVPPFLSLIVPQATTSKRPSPQQSECSRGQIMEPLQMECKDLSCPMGTFAEYGECMSTLGSTMGYTVSLYFDIILPEEIDKRSINLNTLLQEIISFMKTVFAEEKGTCDICKGQIDLFETGATFTLDVSSTHSCSRIQILKSASSFFRNVPVQLYSTSLMQNVLIIGIFDIDNTDVPKIDFQMVGAFDCYINKRYSFDTVHCPSFTANVSEITRFISDANVIDEIMSHGFHHEQDTFKICLHEYKSILNAKSTGTFNVCYTFSVLVGWNILIHFRFLSNV